MVSHICYLSCYWFNSWPYLLTVIAIMGCISRYAASLFTSLSAICWQYSKYWPIKTNLDRYWFEIKGKLANLLSGWSLFLICYAIDWPYLNSFLLLVGPDISVKPAVHHLSLVLMVVSVTAVS